MPESTDFGLVGIGRKNHLVGGGQPPRLPLNTDSERCLFTQEAASLSPVTPAIFAIATDYLQLTILPVVLTSAAVFGWPQTI